MLGRLERASNKWQQRQEMEVAARVSAIESFITRAPHLEELRTRLLAGGSTGVDEDKAAKVKVVDALLGLIKADPGVKLMQGEFVSIELNTDDLDVAMRTQAGA